MPSTSNRGGNNRGNSNRNTSNRNSNRGNSNRSYGGDQSMFSGNAQGEDQNNYFFMAKDNLQNAISHAEMQLQALQTAYSALEDVEQGNFTDDQNESFSGQGGGNSGGSNGGNRGRQNFADSNDASDGRTMAGRQQDAQDFTPQDLNRFLRDGDRGEDGSYDLRTKEGRALQAAGWVDDDGYAIKGAGRNQIAHSGMNR
jgi:hypothetical protein